MMFYIYIYIIIIPENCYFHAGHFLELKNLLLIMKLGILILRILRRHWEKELTTY